LPFSMSSSQEDTSSTQYFSYHKSMSIARHMFRVSANILFLFYLSLWKQWCCLHFMLEFLLSNLNPPLFLNVCLDTCVVCTYISCVQMFSGNDFCEFKNWSFSLKHSFIFHRQNKQQLSYHLLLCFSFFRSNNSTTSSSYYFFWGMNSRSE
jgi:hypothetical protein